MRNISKIIIILKNTKKKNIFKGIIDIWKVRSIENNETVLLHGGRRDLNTRASEIQDER